MEIQKATGIVLSSRYIGEADCLCTMYTREFGKRDFIFKGLQKSRKRPLIISEPGTIANIVYYFHEEKSLYNVNDYNIIKDNISIRNSLKKIYLLYYILALTEKTTGYNDKNKAIFNLVVSGIYHISISKFPEHLSIFFPIHLLKLHGILPDFNKCKICSQNDYEDFYIDMLDFHPVCERCIGTVKNRTELLDKITKKYLNESLTKKFVSIDHSAFPLNHIIDLLYSITLFIEQYYHVEINPKDLLIAEISASSHQGTKRT